MLLHLSREQIIAYGAGYTYVLPYDDIERKLPGFLLEILEKHTPSQIRVINGPGSFTMLRLGCLTLQTIQTYSDKDIVIYSCSKLLLYRYIREVYNIQLPLFVWMGQRKKMRYIQDITEKKLPTDMIHGGRACRVVDKDAIDPLLQTSYAIDPCEHVLVEQLDSTSMLEWSYDEDGLHIRYPDGHGSYVLTPDLLGLESVDNLQPQYFLEPQIG